MTSGDSSRHSRSARSRTSARHSRRSRSRILDSGQIANELEELFPLLALRGQDGAAVSGDLVVATPALSRLLDPAALDPFALFQLVERRVQRGEVERQCAARSFFDQLRELVAMARLVVEKREDHDLGSAFLRFADRASGLHGGGTIFWSPEYCQTAGERGKGITRGKRGKRG